VAFLTSFLPTVLFDVADFRPVTLGWLFAGTHLLGGLLVLTFGASRATLGLRYAFFVAAIYLISIALRPYVNYFPDSASPIGMAANTVSILITVVMLAVVVAMVMRFLYGDEGLQRRSIYVLVAVALLQPILNGLVLGLVATVGSDVSVNVAGIFGVYLALYRWVYVGVALLITFALILLFAWFRKIKVSSPAPSGEVDG
jgi:hypothetical protein